VKSRRTHVGEKELIDRLDLIATFASDKYSKIPIKGAKGLLRLLCFEPDQSVPLHRHSKADEYFFVIRGKGKVTLGRKEIDVESGCILEATAGLPHRWKNGSDRLVLLSVLIPSSSYNLADEAAKMEII
jgi:quercetin dioxygenase-like cupin family protein